MNNFSPTALLILTHTITGLKYFCKTARLDELAIYKGSGHYWKRHLKAHGRTINTEVYGVFYNKELCMATAIAFSLEHNIVNSELWANLIIENGLDGAGIGKLHSMYGKPHPQRGTKNSILKGRYVGALNPMYGKPSAMQGVVKPKGKDSPLYGRPRPDGGGKPSKAVIATDIQGIQTKFNSLSDASKFVGSDRHSIEKWCSINKVSKEYKWEFAK